MVRTPEQALELIKGFKETPKFISVAREREKVFRALVNGENYKEYLIEKIEGIESESRKKAREKHSKDIRDMFSRVMKKRYNVFDAVGGSEVITIKSETTIALFNEKTSSFKGNKSIEKYLSEYLFNMIDVDPNGLIFIEYNAEEDKIYPTYKSSCDIFAYKTDGQIPEYVIFEPKDVIKQTESGQIVGKEIRYVDAKNDYTFFDVNGTYTLTNEFQHPFSSVPAIVLSDHQKVGSEIRCNQVDQVLELSKDYARDKSILTVYKFLNGFPIHWRYVQSCKKCSGTGRTGNDPCKTCDGKGEMKRGDVTDYVSVSAPREGDPVLTPNIAGYINPSFEVWRQYNEDMQVMESKIFDTIWGTDTVKQEDNNNETATAKFIDTQPITNELSRLASNVEYIHNTLAKFVLEYISKGVSAGVYYKTYGRRFIIESPDVILTKYNESKAAGDPSVVLDRLMNEFIVAKYKNDVLMLSLMLKKIEIEPYIHWDIVTVGDLFGPVEAASKVLFQEWWREADKSLPIEILKEQFKTYKNDGSSKFVPTQPV